MKPIQNGSSPHGGTPDWLLLELEDEFGELFDPCPNDAAFDGLDIDWPLDKVAFVNPPYSRGVIGKWVEKCHDEYLRGVNIILLIPPYCCTNYFHRFIIPHAEIRFIEGRLRFKGYDAPAAFPSILCVFHPEIGVAS